MNLLPKDVQTIVYKLLYDNTMTNLLYEYKKGISLNILKDVDIPIVVTKDSSYVVTPRKSIRVWNGRSQIDSSLIPFNVPCVPDWFLEEYWSIVMEIDKGIKTDFE